MRTPRRLGAALALAAGALFLTTITPAAAHGCPCPGPTIPDPPGTDNPGPLPPLPDGNCPEQWIITVSPVHPDPAELFTHTK